MVKVKSQVSAVHPGKPKFVLAMFAPYKTVPCLAKRILCEIDTSI